MATYHESALAVRPHPTTTLVRTYEIECAHYLTAGVPEGHPCRRLHGHRYVVRLAIRGPVDPATGMLVEYAALDHIVVPAFVEPCDHRCLNDLGELRSGPDAMAVAANPTVENLANWIFNYLEPGLTKGAGCQLQWVEVQEDSRSAVRVER